LLLLLHQLLRPGTRLERQMRHLPALSQFLTTISRSWRASSTQYQAYLLYASSRIG
jgi:hypothetical protein